LAPSEHCCPKEEANQQGGAYSPFGLVPCCPKEEARTGKPKVASKGGCFAPAFGGRQQQGLHFVQPEERSKEERSQGVYNRQAKVNKKFYFFSIEVIVLLIQNSLYYLFILKSFLMWSVAPSDSYNHIKKLFKMNLTFV
jgi:hypothetical protein